MKVNVYTFLDTAAKAHTNPFLMQNDGLAIRAFQDNVNSKDENNMSLHPEQFKLYRVAIWDDQTATYETIEPELIAHGKDLVTVPKLTQEQIHKLIQILEDK